MKENIHLFEEELGQELELREASKACRILLCKSMNVKDNSKWPGAVDWLFETALKFKKTVKKVDQ